MEIVTQYEDIVAAQRLAGVKADYDRKVISSTIAIHRSPRLAHAHAVYSSWAFEKLEQKLYLAWNCIALDMERDVWDVRFYTEQQHDVYSMISK